ncbi:hypothetical protein NQ117_18535 [Paenibacillus sp. SC116]|nr:hypothetical protein [Paenibacillus sp. SC116]
MQVQITAAVDDNAVEAILVNSKFVHFVDMKIVVRWDLRRESV